MTSDPPSADLFCSFSHFLLRAQVLVGHMTTLSLLAPGGPGGPGGPGAVWPNQAISLASPPNANDDAPRW